MKANTQRLHSSSTYICTIDTMQALSAMHLRCPSRSLQAPNCRQSARQLGLVAKALASTVAEASTTNVPTANSLSSSVGALLLSAALLVGGPAHARMEGVNRPELLPPGAPVPVLDVAGFLTDGEEARIRSRAEGLEQATGIKLRVLAQNYPETPGLAIKDYWAVDDNTVVFVADPNTGNILNFNVGSNVDLLVPRTFWTRLAGKFGTKFYWQEKGQDVAIINAVAAIDNCLREPIGKLQCTTLRGELE